MITFCGLKLSQNLQKEKEHLEGALKKERLRNADLKQEHLQILKVMSENHSEGMKKFTNECKEKDEKIFKLTHEKQAIETKIADLEMVIVKMESEKIVCDNIQEDLTKLLKTGKIVSTHKINELQTRIDKLQAIVDASKDIAIEAESKLNAAIQDRKDTNADLKIVKNKLDIKIEQTIKHDEECYEAGARLRSRDAEIHTLNKRVDVLVRDAGHMETLMKGLRLEKIDMLKKSNKMHRENDTERSTQLIELKKEIALKDEQIVQYRRQKVNLEAILVKRFSDIELEQLGQLVNEVDGMIRFDSQVSRLSSYEESDMSFSHRRFRTEVVGCEELLSSTRTNENENTNTTTENTIHNPIVTNQKNSLQNSSMSNENSLKHNRVTDRADENVVDI